MSRERAPDVLALERGRMAAVLAVSEHADVAEHKRVFLPTAAGGVSRCHASGGQIGRRGARGQMRTAPVESSAVSSQLGMAGVLRENAAKLASPHRKQWGLAWCFCRQSDRF